VSIVNDGVTVSGARMKVEMRGLLEHAERVRPVIVYPVALIFGFLVAYAWYLVIVGIILPVFVEMVGAD
jgi:hypothetical protein